MVGFLKNCLASFFPPPYYNFAKSTWIFMKLETQASGVPTNHPKLYNSGGLPQMSSSGVEAFSSFHDLPISLPIQLGPL